MNINIINIIQQTLIIILKQCKDRGKTSTLTNLRDLLLKDPTNTIVDEPLVFDDSNDFAIVIDCDGTRVGILTIGDPGYEIQFKAGLNFCMSKQCNIIVVATRTQETSNEKRTPYGLIWDFINKESCYAFETSTYVTYSHKGEMGTDNLNQLCAISLLNTIKSLMK